MTPDYARGHFDGFHQALADREPTEAEAAAELRAMVVWASLPKPEPTAHLATTGADRIS